MLKVRENKKFLSALIAGLLSLGVAHSAVSLDISQQPLFLQTSADPNIMFILDDSGSMQFEVTPSEAVDYFDNLDRVVYVYPNSSTNTASVNFVYCPYAEGKTSSCDYWQNGDQVVPMFGSSNKWAAYYRSSHNNKTYYDPTVRYDPWAKEDGTFWPAAQPTKAYHNPADITKGWRDLTVNNKQSASCWLRGRADKNSGKDHACRDDEITFYPATYFNYRGTGDVLDAANYSRIQIKSGNTFVGGDGRTDCANTAACTYDEEIQNFANWYSYYRSRVLMSRAGIGQAFASQGEDLRVGFGTLNSGYKNIDGKYTETILRGVRAFSGDDRDKFFENLYEVDIPSQGTPLLKALKNAGEYYSRTDSTGPWSGKPGIGSSAADVACRSSYTILMTDGYGSDYGSVGYGNVDSNYDPPFSDGYSNTLADIAMYYWKEDLNQNLDNKISHPEGSLDTATWQHMVTFGVALGVAGNVNPASSAFDAIDTKTIIPWGDPTSSDASKLDDLLHASVNSRGGFYSAGDPTTFAEQLSAVLSDISDRQGSASSVAANSTRLGTDTAIFQALFNSDNWSGEVRAIEMDTDGTLSDSAKWTSTGNIPEINRDVFTYNGSKIVDFTWDKLTSFQQSALKGADDEATGIRRLNWIRGANETGMRVRSKLLGDIVNSSPVLAGNNNFYYHLLPASLGGTSYSSYLSETKNSDRTEVLYVGANDGMLHGFNADTGVETFAYIPTGVYGKLKALTESNYGTEKNPHQYYVDGPLYVSDAYFKKGGTGNAEWMNILVGTYGAGAKGLFVLDVTNPSNPETLFELDSSDSIAGQSIGHILEQPLIAPTPAGWKLIFGNGYDSEDEKASLIVVDLENPADIEVISTNSQLNNGLSGPSLLMDAKGVINTVYAGDLQGNLWKFDISEQSSDKWDVAFTHESSDDDLPLFTAKDVNGNPQPITAPPTLGANFAIDNSIMVYFGTGSYFTSSDNGPGSIINSFYGLVDKNERITYSSDRSDILMEKKIVESGDTRTIDNDDDTSWWQDKLGWYLDFGAIESTTISSSGDAGSSEVGTTGERIISKPLLILDRLIFPTLITSEDPCAYGATGWTMELIGLGDPRFANIGVLDNPNTKQDSASNGFSGYISAGKKIYIPTSETSGKYRNITGNNSLPPSRLSWRKF
ncbi:pilus assembly protein [Microbulbifer sp. CnH-101-G]|uniref:pilus assembly protein n=1 Tax=Microbulbifer sp. CnH-101-G TaxID=3243393 RepID=UPI00403965C2